MQAMSSLVKQLIKVFLHRTFLLVAHQKQNARASQKMFRLAILSLLPHKVESAVVVIVVDVVDVIVVAAVAVAADAASAVVAVAVAAAVTVAALHPDIKISAQRVPVSFFTLSRLFLHRIFKTLVSVSAFFRFARSGTFAEASNPAHHGGQQKYQQRGDLLARRNSARAKSEPALRKSVKFVNNFFK